LTLIFASQSQIVAPSEATPTVMPAVAEQVTRTTAPPIRQNAPSQSKPLVQLKNKLWIPARTRPSPEMKAIRLAKATKEKVIKSKVIKTPKKKFMLGVRGVG
jgi:hypothetical protein